MTVAAMPAVVGVITIDGPAASGKSSAAREVAARLGVPYVSSGLLYRAATYLALRRGVDPRDEEAVVGLLAASDVELLAQTSDNRVLVGEEDVTGQLHTDAIDAAVSAVAVHPRVRAWVDDRLRELRGSFVVEGRDMGTAVFPDAASKFYLTAPAEVRAARRVGERSAALEEVTEALKRRDRLDARQLAPAEDAVVIDTGDLSLEQVVARVLAELARVGRR